MLQSAGCDDLKKTAGFGSLDGVKVIEKTGNSVTLEFTVPAASPYFDGHFPDFPILPAVAQAEMVLRFAAEYLCTGIDIREIRRIKFSNFIQPDKIHFLKIEKNEKNLSFKIYAPKGGTVYSSGTIIITGNGFPVKNS